MLFFSWLQSALVAPCDEILQYAFASQLLSHGYNPSVAVREVSPREGEATLREEDILDIIEKEGKSIALVIFSGVQYYTGQLFPMETVTKAAQAQVSPAPPSKSKWHQVDWHRTGLHLWLGSRPRCWECTHLVA